MITREELIRLIDGTLESDIPFDLYGQDRLADYILDEIEKANTQGYFRAMKDIQTGAIDDINRL